MVAPNQRQPNDSTSPHDDPPPGSLEPLSQDESRFLSQYFRDFKEDLIAWAAATGIAIDALAKWLNQPHIAAYVAVLRHHQAQATKRKCIDLLSAIVDSDEPLPEKRRAATTLLRAITPTGRSASRRPPRDNRVSESDPSRQAPANAAAAATDHAHRADAAAGSTQAARNAANKGEQHTNNSGQQQAAILDSPARAAREVVDNSSLSTKR